MAKGGQKYATTTGTSNTTQTAAPLSAQEGDFQQLWNWATGAAQKVQGQQFGGDIVAGATPDSYAGLDLLRAAAPILGEGAGDVRKLGLDTISGKYLDPTTNPFLTGTINASIAPVTKSLTESVLPNIKDALIASGAYGGSRQDLQENSAVQDWGRTAGDIASKIGYQNYASERQNQLAAPALLTAANALTEAPGLELLKTGEAGRQLNQLSLDNALQKFQMGLQSPFYGLGDLANLLTAGGFKTTTGVGGTTQTGLNPNYESNLAAGLKDALGLAGVASGFFGAPKGGSSAVQGIMNLFKRA